MTRDLHETMPRGAGTGRKRRTCGRVLYRAGLGLASAWRSLVPQMLSARAGLSRVWRRPAGRAAISAVVGWVLVAAAFLVLVAARPYPVESLTTGFPESWRIYDADGDLLREVVNGEGARAHWTPLATISPLLVDATLAVEDSRFHSHGGVDGHAVVRAMVQNVMALGVVSGASTLTMQLARLVEHHPQRTLLGKVGQVVDAWRIERVATKATILEQYLNRAPYGAGTVGIQAASLRYFGKSTPQLSLAEAALIAGLPKAPSLLNPLRHFERARKRQRHVLDRMLATGRIDATAHARARREKLRLMRRPPEISAMHFTEYVLAQGPDAGELHTTLQSDLQIPVERLLEEHVAALALGGLTNAAVVVLDNAACDIQVMVGSVDYGDPAGGSVNGATAPRQPGSTLKPFTYAMAFEQSFTPATILSDIPTQYPGVDGSLLRPRNYSERFLGPIMAGDALGRSLNVPAIRLANAVGIEKILAKLVDLGFGSLNESAEHYGLGLTLGNGEVKLLELAQAFASLARGGLRCKARSLRNRPPAVPRRVFSEEVAFLITHILSDERLRVRAFGANNPLLFGYPVAVKTGTSSNWRDSWALGYTAEHTIAVWTGDFSGRPMQQLSGAIGAGPLFRKVVDLVTLRGALPRPPARPGPPTGVEEILVCPLSGMRPSEHCPNHRAVTVLAAQGVRPACTWHQPRRIDRRNGLRASARCPQRFVSERVFEILPPRFARWQGEHPELSRPPPSRHSPHCPPAGVIADAVIITHPRPGEVFLVEPGYDRSRQTLPLSAEVDPAVARVTWLVNGRRLAEAPWPYAAAWPLARGHHRLEVVAGTQRSEPVEIEVR